MTVMSFLDYFNTCHAEGTRFTVGWYKVTIHPGVRGGSALQDERSRGSIIDGAIGIFH
jgi:hypothetical protein